LNILAGEVLTFLSNTSGVTRRSRFADALTIRGFFAVRGVGDVSSKVPQGSTGALGGLDRFTESLDAINLDWVTSHLPFSPASFTLGATHAG
jgi:hypothetical protein